MSAPVEQSGRYWAFIAIGFGACVSIAANVAHSYLPPEGANTGWRPETGAVVFSVFWPVALFFAVEIMARIKWPRGWQWKLVRFGGLLPVTAVAAIVSYQHLSGLLAHYGENGMTSTIGPLAVDGLMVMATGALIATKAEQANSVPITTVVQYRTPAGPLGPSRSDIAQPAPLAATGSSDDAAQDMPADTAGAVAWLCTRHPEWTQKQVAAYVGVSERTVRRYWATQPA